MKEMVYLSDSYAKTVKTRVRKAVKKGDLWHLYFDRTVIYPEGGGQPSDTGEITGKTYSGKILHAAATAEGVRHECRLNADPKIGDEVTVAVDWEKRYFHMRLHSAGHIVHEAVMSIASGLIPVSGCHEPGKAAIVYSGELPVGKSGEIERTANGIVARNIPITTEFVTFEELTRRASYVPEKLPQSKPLRIMEIAGFQPIPDGGTQVRTTGEVGVISVTGITNDRDTVTVFYDIEKPAVFQSQTDSGTEITGSLFTAEFIELEKNLIDEIAQSDVPPDQLKLAIFGAGGTFTRLAKKMKDVPRSDRSAAGIVINEVKQHVTAALETYAAKFAAKSDDSFDPTVPGILPPIGHLHLITQAIREISDIFARIGFQRVRHPEADWDYYAFEALNMPPAHPARDEWETFFLDYPGRKKTDTRSMVLTPHTSNGQVREMEKGRLPIRMINIAACYRRQSDVSHAPMFHQFEGLYVDHSVSIAHLKGVISFFVRNFYGPEREIRLRPFHFQFTEPSFEIDVTCGLCLGKGVLPDGGKCRLCKSGWLELGGAGMVHPNVLKAGRIDPQEYNGFAFGWGVERTYMMKSGMNIDDVRLLYSNDIRFLEQF